MLADDIDQIKDPSLVSPLSQEVLQRTEAAH